MIPLITKILVINLVPIKFFKKIFIKILSCYKWLTMGNDDIYELRDVRASPLPYHSYDNYRGQSCSEDTSKNLGVSCWYWIHDFVATFRVNYMSICLVFCSQFLQILTLDSYGLMDLSWQLHKGMTIVCRSYVIGYCYWFVNHIYECGVK